MIVKTPRERAILKENGTIHQSIIADVKKLLTVWNTGKRIDALAQSRLLAHNARSAFLGQYDFPAHIIVCINDVAVHGVPNDNPFREWDVVTVDFWVKKNWLLTDAAFTEIVGTPKDPIHQTLIDTSLQALKNGMQKALPGNKTGDIGEVIEDTIVAGWFHIIPSLSWHWLGKSLHDRPHIYNYWPAHKGEKLKEGHYVAIEPIVGLTTWDVYDTGEFAIASSDGNIAIQVEHCWIITKNGFDIIA